MVSAANLQLTPPSPQHFSNFRITKASESLNKRKSKLGEGGRHTYTYRIKLDSKVLGVLFSKVYRGDQRASSFHFNYRNTRK